MILGDSEYKLGIFVVFDDSMYRYLKCRMKQELMVFAVVRHLKNTKFDGYQDDFVSAHAEGTRVITYIHLEEYQIIRVLWNTEYKKIPIEYESIVSRVV